MLYRRLGKTTSISTSLNFSLHIYRVEIVVAATRRERTSKQMTASTEEASITGLREALRVGSFLPRTPDISQKMEMSVPHKADIVQNRQN